MKCKDCGAIILLLCLSETAFAQSSGRFLIECGVIAGGGTTFSSSTRFQLGSTIAQPLAAAPASTRFSIRGGFWIWPAPNISVPAKNGTNYILSIQTELGKTYTVQYVNALSSANWQTLSSFAGSGAVKNVTNSASEAAARFYRVLEQ